MLLIDYRKVKKSAEIALVRYVVSEIIIRNSSRARQEVLEAIEEEVSSLQDRLKAQSEHLNSYLKGKFGNDVRETLKNQSERISSL